MREACIHGHLYAKGSYRQRGTYKECLLCKSKVDARRYLKRKARETPEQREKRLAYMRAYHAKNRHQAV